MLEKDGHTTSKHRHLIVIFSCMLLQMFPFGMSSEVPPLFVRPLNTTFGFSIASIGFIFTIGSVASSIASPFIGKLFDRFSTKLLMLAGVIVAAIGLFINAVSTQIWQYYVANAIIQVGVVTYSSLGIPYLIGKWFTREEKPTAMGFAFAGGAIGNFFWQPIVSQLLNHMDVHHVYFICAVIALVTGIIIVTVFVKNRTAVTDPKTNKEPDVILRGIGFKKTTKIPAFWIIAVSMLFLGVNIAAQSSQYANYFGALELDAVTIGFIGSTFAISALCGNIFGGIIISKFGLLNGARVAAILQFTSALAMLILGFVPMHGFGYLWAVFYGLSGFIYMSGPAIMVQYLFGMKESSQILGSINIFFAVGFALGNVIFGMVVDYFNFQTAWIMIIICILIAYILMLGAIKKIEKQHYADVL